MYVPVSTDVTIKLLEFLYYIMRFKEEECYLNQYDTIAITLFDKFLSPFVNPVDVYKLGHVYIRSTIKYIVVVLLQREL